MTGVNVLNWRGVCASVLAVSTLQGCATRAPQPQPPVPPVAGPTLPGQRPPAHPRPDQARPLPPGLALRIDVGPRGHRQVETVALEDYVRDVVVGEISVAVGDAALARPVYGVQAIVARTYALAVRGRHADEGFDLCSTTHCQVYARGQWRRSRWAAQVDEAVRDTAGQYLSAAGRPIEAVFHAHCGGHTSAAAEVWRSRGAAYLQPVPDPYCVREQPAAWTTAHALDLVRTALEARTRTSVGGRLDGVQVLRRDAGGRVMEVVLTGPRSPVVTGEDFRLALLAAAGARSLRSARFEVRREGGQLVFSGRGSGHGVGLCQVGLIGRLRAGQTPLQILRAYYTGVDVSRLAGT